MNILIAEDDAVARQVLQLMLERAGHTLKLTVDGEQAWTLWQRERPRVVISDWAMPGVDGLELCRRIRGAGNLPYTYFIMVTGHGGRENYLNAIASGVDDFIAKPVDSGELLARLQVADRVLGLRRTIDTMEKLLPICSYCKRIRRENQQWQTLEKYVSEQAQAALSHGICPDCYAKVVQPQIDALPDLSAAGGRKGP